MKTQSMLISTKQKLTTLINQDLKFSLTIRDQEIEIVDTTKFLGLQMDNSLDWKYHVSGLSSKVFKAVGFLKYTKYIVPLKTLDKLYAGILEPHFHYCSSVWGCCSVGEKNKLQKLHKKLQEL